MTTIFNILRSSLTGIILFHIVKLRNQ